MQTEKFLSQEQEDKIRERAIELRNENQVKIHPIVVFGETEYGEKEMYTIYLSAPTFPQFSKFMTASKRDEAAAMRTLAKDCYVAGDRELIDNESLFLFGLMGQLSELLTTRQSTLVNF